MARTKKEPEPAGAGSGFGNETHDKLQPGFTTPDDALAILRETQALAAQVSVALDRMAAAAQAVRS